MRIVPHERDLELARALHAEFSEKPGSKHIASVYALAGLSSLLNRTKPTRVLEIGAGIGTLTRLLMSHPVGIERLVTLETNDFCYEQLRKNLPIEAAPHVEIVRSMDELGALQEHFELIVLDGVARKSWEHLFAKFQKGTMVYFEGVQSANRLAVHQALARRGLGCNLTNHRPPGRKLLTARLQDKRFLGVRVPKVRILHKVKGYWVGMVEEAVAVKGRRESTAVSPQLRELQSTSRG